MTVDVNELISLVICTFLGWLFVVRPLGALYDRIWPDTDDDDDDDRPQTRRREAGPKPEE